MSDNSPVEPVVRWPSFLRNCTVTKRSTDEGPLFYSNDKEITVALDGYAIVPKEDLQAMARVLWWLPSISRKLRRMSA